MFPSKMDTSYRPCEAGFWFLIFFLQSRQQDRPTQSAVTNEAIPAAISDEVPPVCSTRAARVLLFLNQKVRS